MTRAAVIKTALVSEAFELALGQPDRASAASAFSWIDDNAETIAQAIDKALVVEATLYAALLKGFDIACGYYEGSKSDAVEEMESALKLAQRVSA